MSDSFFCRWVISGRGTDPTRTPSKGLRKAPVTDSHKRVKPVVKKASTLRKSSVHMKQFEEQNAPVCHQRIIHRVPYPPKLNRNDCQHFRGQRNAPVLSVTDSGKSLLKGCFSPKESTGSWKYTQCPKHHDQRNMYTGSLHEIEKYSVTYGSLHEIQKYSVTYTGESGSTGQYPWEVFRNCDCRSPLRKAHSKLLSDNSKGRGSGPLYNMVLKKSRAG